MVLKDMAQAGVDICITDDFLNLLRDFGSASATGPDRKCFLVCHNASINP